MKQLKTEYYKYRGEFYEIEFFKQNSNVIVKIDGLNVYNNEQKAIFKNKKEALKKAITLIKYYNK